MERLPAATGADAVPARPPHARGRDLQPAEPVLQRLGDDVRRFDDRSAADHRRVHRPPEVLHRIILRSSERMTPAVPSKIGRASCREREKTSKMDRTQQAMNTKQHKIKVRLP